MPGSSLWLLPPPAASQNPLFPLIEKTSARFGSPHRFLPHITLTSELLPSTYGSDPQGWLDSLELPAGEDIRVRYEKLDSENVFFRKLYIKCAKTSGVEELAMRCRQKVEGFGDAQTAQTWVAESYKPHLSLLYHDCPVVDAQGLLEVEQYAEEFGIDVHGKATINGWEGGRVVLVPTDQPISEWNPIAERRL
ncbi:hypothetical protein ACN47E_005400 [Coniothyrium glycines]